MNEKREEQGVSLLYLWKLLVKNLFSVGYFILVGIILAVVYTQFLVKPTYKASGNIDNVGAVSSALMQTITTRAAEDLTIEQVVEDLELSEAESSAKVAEIKANLTVSNYNTTTLKVTVTYNGSDKEEVAMIVNSVIDVTISRFVADNPTLENKVKKQSNAIVAYATGLSDKIIFLVFLVGGAGIGVLVGVGGDLINSKVLFGTDFEEFGLESNVISLKRQKGDISPLLESENLGKGLLVLQDSIEGACKHNPAKIIGITNLGYESFDPLSVVFGEALAGANFKVLVVDLNLEKPLVGTHLNIETSDTINGILENKMITPVKVKDNLSIITSAMYEYPARFLKEPALKTLLDSFREEFDYILVNLPVTTYYPALVFNFGLVDMLLINASFEKTKMKSISKVLSSVEPQHYDKFFINGIDSRIQKNWADLFKKMLPKKKVAK